MGNYAIVILGTGAHHNKDYPQDANKMMEKFVEELKKASHTVEVATFTYGGREVFPPSDGFGIGTYQPANQTTCTKTRDDKIRAIFAEELKTSAEDLIKACDGTAEITTAEATNAGGMDVLMKVYKRINDEVLNG